MISSSVLLTRKEEFAVFKSFSEMFETDFRVNPALDRLINIMSLTEFIY